MRCGRHAAEGLLANRCLVAAKAVARCGRTKLAVLLEMSSRLVHQSNQGFLALRRGGGWRQLRLR